MVRKVKYIVILIIVMSLIYVQQSAVIYAGGDDLNEDKEEIIEGQLPAEGEDKDPEEGEGKDPEEGEGKGPEEGEDKDPEEGEDKDPEEGEGKDPEEDDKPPIEEDDKPPVEEEKKKIEEYKIKIPKANGKHGYYIKKPEITICHVSEAGVTKYCLKHGSKKLEENILRKKGEEAVISAKKFLEGKNILYVWMENEEGEKQEKYELTREFLIDTQAPEIQMSVPQGFDSWYQEQTVLSVAGEDAGSGVVSISCQEGTQSLGNISKSQGEFVLSKPSVSGRGVDITVTAEDKAGNKSERIKTVFIDKIAPKISIAGAKNYMITSKTVNLTYEISEDNMLQEFYVRTIWENARGKKKLLSSAVWENNSTGKMLVQTLKNDGIYHVEIQARDLSGQVSAKEMQVIIDKTNPVIRYVETLNGQQLKKFKWEYPTQQMIQDFTTYVYEMRVDGQLYHMGETINLEGKHRMTVKATDAAGNQAQAAADFIVDHTAPEIVFCNIENGQEYEEERTFGVELAREEDTIQQIQINGVSQKIDLGKKKYERSLQACNEYEVTVKASDKAGNEAVKSIFFKIIPKKSLVEKIINPVKIRWNIGEKAALKFPEASKQGEWQKNNNSMSVLVKIMILGTLIGAVVIIGILYYKKWRKYGAGSDQ